MSAPPATPLGEALEKSIWELHQLEKIIEVGAPSDERVIEKIEDFVKTLPGLREAAEKCGDVEIPVDLLREIDQGKKPMRFMINQILAAGNVNEVRCLKSLPQRSARIVPGKQDLVTDRMSVFCPSTDGEGEDKRL